MLRILRPVNPITRPHTYLACRRAFSHVPFLRSPTGEEYIEGRERTHQSGLSGIKTGTQHAATMTTEKMTRSNTSYDSDKTYSNEKKNAISCTQHWEDSAHSKRGQELYRQFKAQDRKDAEAAQADQSPAESNDQDEQPKKRGLGANQNGSSKKQKNGGSSSQPRGIAGDKTRVPTEGQKVQWHSESGWVDGELVEVVYKEKKVKGKSVKGSNEDPMVVLKSSTSGEIAVLSPDAVYFD
jgi:hypothetical protein